MRTVFISHSRHDKPFVRKLARELRKHDIFTWVDEKQIKVGDSIPKRIHEGIARCDCFLLILSEEAIKSNWVIDELNSAYITAVQDHGRPILPVRVDDAEIPAGIRHLRYADFRKSFQSGLRQLLSRFKIEAEDIVFMTRDKRVAKIEALLPTTNEFGEMPIEIIELIEDESQLSVFESKIEHSTERLVLLNSIDAIRWLAEAADGRLIRRYASLKPLIELYEKVEDPAVKHKTVEAVAAIDATSTLDWLIDRLKYMPPETKASILMTWGNEIGMWKGRTPWIRKIVPLLHEFTRWPQQECLYFSLLYVEEDFRYWVFRCLCSLKRKASVRFIEEFLSTHSWPVETLGEAAMAHWRITGKPDYLEIMRKAARAGVPLASGVLKEMKKAKGLPTRRQKR